MLDVYFVRTIWVVIFTLFYCLLDLSCGECNVVSLYFLCCSVNGSVYLVCLYCKLFHQTIHNILGVVVIFLLNVMEVLSVGGVAYVCSATSIVQLDYQRVTAIYNLHYPGCC